jgi:dinuclear metal center YbgI/SA1388 family protein
MTKTINGHEIIQLFEQFSPKSYAVEGDKIGLQIGTLNKTVSNVMVTLDVLEETVDEAIAKNVDLIIAHHPPVFRPLKHVITDQPGGRLIEKCIKRDIAVYAAHTNLDVADGGVNDMLAEALELKNTKVLVPTYEEPLKKLVVYVPKDYEEQVAQSLETPEPVISAPTATVRFLQKESAASSRCLKPILLSASGASLNGSKR